MSRYVECARCTRQVGAGTYQRHLRTCLAPRTLERLFEVGNVDVGTDPNDCWIWRGLVANGYGRHKDGGAHQLALILSGQPRPEGYEACHHCDTKLCVRPDHLYWGTRSQNIKDMHDRGLRVYSVEERLAKGERARALWASYDADELARVKLVLSEKAFAREARRRSS